MPAMHHIRIRRLVIAIGLVILAAAVVFALTRN